MKRSIIKALNIIGFLFLMVSIIIFPETTYKSSLDGLNLWFNIVCPALLPFFICLDILKSYGIIRFFGAIFQPLMGFLFNIPGEGAFAFIMSISSGYPVGANVVANLRRDNICTKTECQRMLSLCSTSGPLFIIGAVSVGMLQDPKVGIVLLLSHYLSAISIGFFMRFYKKKDRIKKKIHLRNPIDALKELKNKNMPPLGQVLTESIVNSINLVLMIGGYIIFFSVISSIIKKTSIVVFLTNLFKIISKRIPISDDICTVFIVGFLEVTNGIKECAALNTLYAIKIALIGFFIGFGGLSINAQVLGIIYDTDINFSLYFLNKILQGIIASFYSIFLLKFFLQTSAISNSMYITVFKNLTYFSPLKLSICSLTFGLFLLLFYTYITMLIKAVKNRLN